ncbi:glycogen synthase GlgA [Vulcaniibacterium tengchongense]|uniref:Glycogen synthase n=1 Tax=Vulcaniibacterium tengchongense TaxID=1273429 RepID=A0A3N4UVK9_9GAMM|nr:glycogen synthase GlgA [Vulcaniibacterium tengchongense]RPE74802.1 starch synthase [Vulcaniibacterium tengchongense]
MAAVALRRLDADSPSAEFGPTRKRLPLRDARGRFLPKPPGRRPAPRRDVLFVTSEMSDFLKTGGLGDVAAALPRALQGGCDARVLIPGYPAVLRRLGEPRVVGRVRAHAGLPECAIGRAALPDGLPVYVLVNPALFERDGSPYVAPDGSDWSDNAIRFATLAHAAAEIAAGRAGLGWRPQLLHLNDWPGALAAAYVSWRGGDTPSLLTIHNLAYQGLFPAGAAAALGVPKTALADLEFHGQLSFLRGGIVHAAHVNTVSASYARQITEPAHGCGLDRLLARCAATGRLSGILNGIDASWDPRTDPHLHAHFAAGDWQGKRANARQVRREFGLPDATGPLFALVSRLVHQKGVDLICEVAPQIVAAGGQVVAIGTGEPRLEREVAALARRFPGRVGAHIGFEEGLARRMFAGSDFLLMPSRFEPCGLSQMYAQRFASLPIVHATGGLIDTVEDGVTGFQCREATADALRRGVQRAFRVYRLPGLLDAMRRAAMRAPAGWDAAARQYQAHYDRMLAAAAMRPAVAA